MSFPPNIQRGLIGLLILLAGISLCRLHVQLHKLQQRLEQQEEGLFALHNEMDAIGHELDLLSQSSLEPEASGPQPKDVSHRSDAFSHKPKAPNYEQRHARPRSTYRMEERRQAASTPRDTNKKQPAAAESPAAAGSPARTTTAAGRVQKFTEPRLFNLNQIDSITLIRIPGIAARTASTILKKRAQYGGFYDPRQLQDFLTWEAAQDYMEEWCTQWFTAEVSDVKTLSVNRASFTQLLHHPYLNYEQTQELVRYRTRHKQIKNIDELKNLSTFQPEDIQRLAFYLNFE